MYGDVLQSRVLASLEAVAITLESIQQAAMIK